MNNEEIKDLIKLVSRLGLGQVEIEKDGFKINIKGPKLASNGTIAQAPMVVQSVVPTPPIAAPLAQTVSNEPVKTASESLTAITVRSSMIGTFYRSAGPDKPPFVEVGTEIKKGDKICIIEAMKLFNEIESEVSGKVVKVLIDDASPVEFDQPLFLVEPA